MNRRIFLTLSAGAAAFALTAKRPAVADLEPDRLYRLYRRHHLMIVGQRDDAKAGAFAGAVIDVLAHALPAARAQLARAADNRRVGVLIATQQQDVAIMSSESADALFLAKAPFDDLRDVPLRVLVSFGSHFLVCRPDFTARDAYLLAQALAEHRDLLPAPAGVPDGIVPAHRGAQALFAGEAIPDWS